MNRFSQSLLTFELGRYALLPSFVMKDFAFLMKFALTLHDGCAREGLQKIQQKRAFLKVCPFGSWILSHICDVKSNNLPTNDGAHILDLEMIGFVTSGLGQLSKTYNWHQRTIGITDNWPYATEKNQNYFVSLFKTLHFEQQSPIAQLVERKALKAHFILATQVRFPAKTKNIFMVS